MNVRSITFAAGATLACLVAGTVSAQEAEPDSWMVLGQSVSRASVEAETLRALAADRVAGRRQAQEAGPDDWMQVASTKTRRQVIAELFAARRSGEFDRIQAEAAGFDLEPAPVRLAGPAR